MQLILQTFINLAVDSSKTNRKLSMKGIEIRAKVNITAEGEADIGGGEVAKSRWKAKYRTR